MRVHKKSYKQKKTKNLRKKSRKFKKVYGKKIFGGGELNYLRNVSDIGIYEGSFIFTQSKNTNSNDFGYRCLGIVRNVNPTDKTFKLGVNATDRKNVDSFKNYYTLLPTEIKIATGRNKLFAGEWFTVKEIKNDIDPSLIVEGVNFIDLRPQQTSD
jgi:cytochrome c peroxidase